MKKLFVSMALAFTVFIGNTALAQNNPFNPDYQWCNIQGSVATRGATKWQCLTPGSAGQAVISGGPGADATWFTPTGLGTVTSVGASGGTTGLTFSGGPVTAAGTLTAGGVLVAPNGGTGQSAYAVGDMLYASSSTALSKLAVSADKILSVIGGIPAWISWAPTVVNNTALSALTSTNYSTVYRSGYATSGDAPTVVYHPSNAACALNAGAGDGGSQVPSADGKCWIAAFGDTVALSVWGADRTGVSNSATQINNAMIAASTGTYALFVDGRFLVNSTVAPVNGAAGITILGVNGNVSQFATACPTGASTFVAGGNIDLLNLRSLTATLKGVCFEMASAAGTRTSGAAVSVGGNLNSGHIVISDNTVIFPYDGFRIGNGAVVSMPLVTNNHVNFPSRDAFSVGRSGAFGTVNELRLYDNTVVCPQVATASFTGSITGTALTVSNVVNTISVGDVVVDADGLVAANTTIVSGSGSTWVVSVSQVVGPLTMASAKPYVLTSYGLHVFDSGLTISDRNEFSGCGHGTAVTPGANQLVLFWGSGVQADGSIFNGFLADITDPTGALINMMLTGFWVGQSVAIEKPFTISNSASGFAHVANIGPGVIHGTSNSTSSLIHIRDIFPGVSISNVSCTADVNGTTNTCLTDENQSDTTVTGLVTNSGAGTLAFGIKSDPRYDNKSYTNNNLIGATVPLAWTISQTSSPGDVIANNVGIDNVSTTIASASTINLPYGGQVFVSGVGVIQNITNVWSNRQITLIPTGAFTLTNTGTGITKLCLPATTVVAGVFQPITLTYSTPLQCWFAK